MNFNTKRTNHMEKQWQQRQGTFMRFERRIETNDDKDPWRSTMTS